MWRLLLTMNFRLLDDDDSTILLVTSPVDENDIFCFLVAMTWIVFQSRWFYLLFGEIFTLFPSSTCLPPMFTFVPTNSLSSLRSLVVLSSSCPSCCHHGYFLIFCVLAVVSFQAELSIGRHQWPLVCRLCSYCLWCMQWFKSCNKASETENLALVLSDFVAHDTCSGRQVSTRLPPYYYNNNL